MYKAQIDTFRQSNHPHSKRKSRMRAVGQAIQTVDVPSLRVLTSGNTSRIGRRRTPSDNSATAATTPPDADPICLHKTDFAAADT